MIANIDPFALRIVQWGNAKGIRLPGFNSIVDQLVHERALAGDPEAWIAMRPKVWRWRTIGLSTVEKAAELTDISVDELCGPKRTPDIVWVRNAICLALRRKGQSYHGIGRLLGGRDHSTVIHAFRRASAMERIDIDYALLVEKLVKS